MIASDPSASVGGFEAAQPAETSASKGEMSVLGALLFSAASVAMAVLGMMVLAAVVTGIWWLVSHIPVPGWVMHVLHAVGLV